MPKTPKNAKNYKKYIKMKNNQKFPNFKKKRPEKAKMPRKLGN